MTDFYPLVTVAAELNIGVRELLARANGGVELDECGIRVLPAALVRELVAERDARIAAQRDRDAAGRAEREQQAAEHKAWIAGIKARGRRQRALAAGTDLTAAELMTLDAGEFERAASKSPTSAYMSGDMSYHPISEKRK